VPPYLVAAGLAGVVAQRLVRRLCAACGGRGTGCDRCHDGYRGRIGVFEVLVVDDGLRAEILREAPLAALRAVAAEHGMRPMTEDARRKVEAGITSSEELARVAGLTTSTTPPCTSCGAEVPSGALGCPGCGALRRHACACGHDLEKGWRFCPFCLRPAALGNSG